MFYDGNVFVKRESCVCVCVLEGGDVCVVRETCVL